MSEYHVHRITSDAPDVQFRQIARLHRSEIHSGFLASLGENFLTELYRALSRNPDVFLIAARQDEEILGYICGATSTAGVYRRFLIGQGWRVLPVVMWRLLSVRSFIRVAETLLYPSKTAHAGLPDPEILNFCVSSDHQRRGIGRRLFAALCAEFAQRDVSRIRIVTGETQTSARRFYESLGARKVEEIEVHRGVNSIVYVFDIPPREREAAA